MTARTVNFLGGPLDGHELDTTDWPIDDITTGVYHVVHGWEARAEYTPDPDGDPHRWHYRGPVWD
ncbi:hypothetical protein ACFYXM_11355 [Streptomyces sp. NPDC002476]|uniref:hypothetical protein n=1 Tax=Streptomyces sp. NPDC002476 TaxID=3364648 RepID=UPI0036B1F426